MNKEFQDKLYKDFPLLYSNRNKSIKESCMAWGICVGDGWYKIIYDLSSKLEKIIHKYLEDNKDSVSCVNCHCDQNNHDRQRIASSIDGQQTKVNICDKFETDYPRAEQVKEKFAALRFYMSSYTDEIDEVIKEAAGLSKHICEECGQPGKQQHTQYWIYTLCDHCFALKLSNKKQ